MKQSAAGDGVDSADNVCSIAAFNLEYGKECLWSLESN